MALSGYDFTRADCANLLIMSQFPESTVKESRVIREWLMRHCTDYDRMSFRVRLGNGAVIDPTLPLSVQKQIAFASKKKMDLLAWAGSQPTIVEFKYLVTPAALGQIQSYRVFFLEEQPDAPDPALVVAGAASDPDTIRALQAHDVTVYIYAAALVGTDAAVSSV
jgi:hypothetical protein